MNVEQGEFSAPPNWIISYEYKSNCSQQGAMTDLHTVTRNLGLQFNAINFSGERSLIVVMGDEPISPRYMEQIKWKLFCRAGTELPELPQDLKGAAAGILRNSRSKPYNIGSRRRFHDIRL